MTRASMIKEKVFVANKRNYKERSKGPFSSRLPSTTSWHSPRSPTSTRATLDRKTIATVRKTKPASTTSDSCESAAYRAACSS